MKSPLNSITQIKHHLCHDTCMHACMHACVHTTCVCVFIYIYIHIHIYICILWIWYPKLISWGSQTTANLRYPVSLSNVTSRPPTRWCGASEECPEGDAPRMSCGTCLDQMEQVQLQAWLWVSGLTLIKNQRKQKETKPKPNTSISTCCLMSLLLHCIRYHHWSISAGPFWLHDPARWCFRQTRSICQPSVPASTPAHP